LSSARALLCFFQRRKNLDESRVTRNSSVDLRNDIPAFKPLRNSTNRMCASSSVYVRC
jgi:hypothetical protein